MDPRDASASKNVFDVDFALLFTLMWSRSTWRRYDQGEIRKCLYHIPPPFASHCLYLPAVFIAPLDAGHLDQQDWIKKK